MTLRFQKKPLACFVSALLFPVYGYATTVRDDIDFQQFRDLAENKGEFAVGESSIQIKNKSGEVVGTMFDGVPVPDLKVANSHTAVSALVEPQYASTVKHGGLAAVHIDAQSSNPDAHHFSYESVNEHGYEADDLNPDYKIVRLKKLVTEVVPIEMADAGTTAAPYLDRERFSHFVRVGSGRHTLQDAQGNSRQVAGSYQFVTGGTPTHLEEPNQRIVHHKGLLSATGSLYSNEYGPMATSTNPGDSGSPLFAFDKQKNRWVLVGHAQGLIGKGTLSKDFDTNLFVISRPDFLKEVENQHMLATHADHYKGEYRWRSVTPDSSALVYRDQVTETVELANPTVANGEGNGKSVFIYGNPGTLVLENDINQGAGFLRFNNDYTVKGVTPETTWVGSGVYVAPHKQVVWQLKNPKGDRLSKLGEGVLYVNAEGVNEGDISIGDGKVILEQRADSQNRKQAFRQIGLTSGRGTLTLNGENQFNPDGFYFGFRGGRLDLNGHSMTFNRIQNSDDGGKIVNHNPDQTSTLTIRGPNATEKDIFWQRWSQPAPNHLTIYEYVNIYNNDRKDYFVLKGNPSAHFPAHAQSNEHWEFLGSDKAVAVKEVLKRYNQKHAFNGYLGEPDVQRTNGALNVNYSASAAQQLMLLSGGMGLNGDLSVKKGQLLLSGRPTPHAYDYLNNKEVIRDDDWQNREFVAKRFLVSGDAQLMSGRNVTRLQGDIYASDKAKLQLGFEQNRSAICVRSDYSGLLDCQKPGVLLQKDFDALPSTQIVSDIHLKQQSSLHLGKAHLKGAIHADKNTRTELGRRSEWTLFGDSRVGNLKLNAGTRINLNPLYRNIGSSQIQNGVHNFNRLTVNGELSGSGQFNFLSNAAAGAADLLDLQGNASGNFAIGLTNTGAEPTSASPVKLVQLSDRHRYDKLKFYLSEHFVDLGAYRYVLAKQGREYRLYSPLKEALSQPIAVVSREEQRRRLQAQAAQQTALAVELSVKLQQKEQENKAWQERILFQQNIAQIERQNEERQRLFAGYFPVDMRQTMLTSAEESKRKAEQAEQEIQRLKQSLEAQTQNLQNIRQSITQAQTMAQNAKNQLNQLPKTQNTVDTNAIRQQTEALCRKNHVASGDCEHLLQDYLAEQNLQEVNRTQRLIEEKSTQKNALAQQLQDKEQQVQRERKYAEQQNAIANKWYYSWQSRNQARQQAQAASRRAEALQNEATQLRNQLNQADDELNALRHNLSALTTRSIYATEISDKEALSLMPEALTVLGDLRQAQLISRYANTALSDNAAQMTDVQRINQSLHGKLTESDTQGVNVWLNHQVNRHRQNSDEFREYHQENHLTQFGGEAALDESVAVGAAFSHSRSETQFDDDFDGESRLNMLSVYGKWRLANQSILGLDVGYAQARNQLQNAEVSSQFDRHITQAGISLAKQWQVAGVDIQPSASLRYHHMNKTGYTLDGAQIYQPQQHFTTYQLGLKASKKFHLNAAEVTPTVQTLYTDFAHQNAQTQVNGHTFNQSFERSLSHQVGVNVQLKQLELSANIGVNQGSQSKHQTQVGAALRYRF